ncbi:hypothetical protein [Streptomyces xantholiticus]|uniref:hypothetical protein n=1 Tax=Streptomyces xantholiticus TaxID=68285 RepID=UPI0016768F6B|nr:hypothetical protein [Streptomyces xantholiticus]GGW63195.1 hypothetical protein GCM10010381_55360 [Streptomyces xantholiticus]
MRTSRKTGQAAVAMCALFGAVLSHGAAHADETHTDAHNGHSVSLISTGQIDDPLEDVLEHAAILGSTYVRD